MTHEEIKKILEKQLLLLSERSKLIAVTDAEGQLKTTEAMIMLAKEITSPLFRQAE